MQDVFQLVQAAIAAGKLTRIPAGKSGLPPKRDEKKQVKLHPIFCGSTFKIHGRKPTLSNLDGDFS